jgi:uncharacterized protein (DUF433 family)
MVRSEIGFSGGRGAALLDHHPLAPYTSAMNYDHLITVEPGKRGGKPCIRGLRLAVADILDYLASGMGPAAILADFPELREEDIHACLAFAADRERRLFSPPAA